MRIVVAGAGDFGISIAQLLANEDFDIVIAEKDASRAELAQHSLDCLVIQGDCASSEIYNRRDIATADMFIACLKDDEMNIVACMLAKKYGIPKTVACVRNVDYIRHERDFLEKEAKIDFLLNTDYIMAKEINRILTASSSLDVEDFAGGRVKLFEVKISDDSPYIYQPIKKLNLPDNILAAIILHNHQVFIPKGDSYFTPGDYVYFIGLADSVSKFAESFNIVYQRPKHILMIGAGRTGRFTAPMLASHGMQIKAIEKDQDRCQLLADELQDGLVLCGDGTNVDLLNEEGVTEADVVLAITDDDRLNMMVALLAKHLGTKRALVRVSHEEYIGLLEKLGLDIVLSTRSLAAEELLRFLHKGNVLNISLLDDANAEALEIIVGKGSQAENKQVMNLNLPEGVLLCALVNKNGETIIPKGSTKLSTGERIVVLAKKNIVDAVTSIFAGKD